MTKVATGYQGVC